MPDTLHHDNTRYAVRARQAFIGDKAFNETTPLLFLLAGRAFVVSLPLALMLDALARNKAARTISMGSINAYERGGPRTVNARGMQGVIDLLQSKLIETALQLQLTPVRTHLWGLCQERVAALMSD